MYNVSVPCAKLQERQNVNYYYTVLKLHIESSIVLVIYLKYCLLFATAQKTGPAFIHPIEEDENDDLTADDTFPPSGAFHILAFSPIQLFI